MKILNYSFSSAFNLPSILNLSSWFLGNEINLAAILNVGSSLLSHKGVLLLVKYKKFPLLAIIPASIALLIKILASKNLSSQTVKNKLGLDFTILPTEVSRKSKEVLAATGLPSISTYIVLRA